MDEDIVKRIEEALRSAGIHVVISGCGCCESPWIEGNDGEYLGSCVRIDSKLPDVS